MAAPNTRFLRRAPLSGALLLALAPLAATVPVTSPPPGPRARTATSARSSRT